MSNRIWPWTRREAADTAHEADPRTEALRSLRQAEVGLAQAKLEKQKAVAQKSRARTAIDLLNDRRKQNHYGEAINASIEAKHRGRHA